MSAEVVVNERSTRIDYTAKELDLPTVKIFRVEFLSYGIAMFMEGIGQGELTFWFSSDNNAGSLDPEKHVTDITFKFPEVEFWTQIINITQRTVEFVFYKKELDLDSDVVYSRSM